jgi:CDP-diacylglycerol--serine O-phosphatidyltransferase
MSNLFPPFEPEGEERRWRRFRPVPFRILLPNLITLLALSLGLTAIRMAIEGRYDYAVAAIVVAAVLDGLDGRIARLLQSTSRFGAELDSLADFVSFGVAPAMVLYMWGLGTLRSVGWIAVLVFAICAGLRLARFNVMIDDPNRPPYAANFFVGMPAPAGAIVVMLPVYLEFLGVPRTFAHAPIALVFVIGIALLMVSKIPTWSGKRVGSRVPREHVLLVSCSRCCSPPSARYPWEVLTGGSFLYLAPFRSLSPLQEARADALRPGGSRPTAAEAEQRPERLN